MKLKTCLLKTLLEKGLTADNQKDLTTTKILWRITKQRKQKWVFGYAKAQIFLITFFVGMNGGSRCKESLANWWWRSDQNTENCFKWDQKGQTITIIIIIIIIITIIIDPDDSCVSTIIGLSKPLCSVIPTIGIISVAFVRFDVLSFWTKRKLTTNLRSKSPLNCTLQISHRFQKNTRSTEREARYIRYIVPFKWSSNKDYERVAHSSLHGVTYSFVRFFLRQNTRQFW